MASVIAIFETFQNLREPIHVLHVVFVWLCPPGATYMHTSTARVFPFRDLHWISLGTHTTLLGDSHNVILVFVKLTTECASDAIFVLSDLKAQE